MPNIIYVKKADNYREVNLFHQYPYVSSFMFWFKKNTHYITKETFENRHIWILPVLQQDYQTNMTKFFKKMSLFPDNKYVFSKNIFTKENKKFITLYDLTYYQGEKLKKFLAYEAVLYILNIQKKHLQDMEITILVEQFSQENIEIIQNFVYHAKSVKIVTPNIFQFKSLEDKLLKKDGIGLQLSNSYRKSLAKSKFIINLDRSEIDVNEYQIHTQAIILQCGKQELTIKTKAFQGLVINNYSIFFRGENIEYDNVLYYESLLEGMEYKKAITKIKEDEIKIDALIRKTWKNKYRRIS